MNLDRQARDMPWPCWSTLPGFACHDSGEPRSVSYSQDSNRALPAYKQVQSVTPTSTCSVPCRISGTPLHSCIPHFVLRMFNDKRTLTWRVKWQTAFGHYLALRMENFQRILRWSFCGLKSQLQTSHTRETKWSNNHYTKTLGACYRQEMSG